MKRIPYRFLIFAIVAFLGAVMILPAISGFSDDAENNAENDGHLIVVEKITDEYLIYLNSRYYFEDSTQFIGTSLNEIRAGSWLIVDAEKQEHATSFILISIRPAPNDTQMLGGTISSLIYDESNEVIGFALNEDTVLLPEAHGEEEHGYHVEVGYGVKVVATPTGQAGFWQAQEIHVLRHHSLLHAMMLLMLQISVILLAAKLAGEVFERYFKQPAVLGELLAGIVISPYALGGMIQIPGVGSLFETHNLSAILKASPLQPDFAVSPELWAIAQIAAIILLFMAGLETDLSRFLKYAGPATVIGMGGVVTPFVLGAFATTWFVPGMEFWSPTSLFMGAIMVATSVGITARVLSDINRLDTSEGVTILAGAVIDDVLGILVLAIVNAIAIAELAGTQIDIMLIGEIALKAVLFWLGLTSIGILSSKPIEKLLNWFKSKGATFALGLSLCFASAAVAEMFGLAMIIGAYSIGLALSDRDIAHTLEEKLTGAYNFVVPIFFVVMGMMVDVNAMLPLFWPYGVVISFFAVISKVFGCGFPALLVGFNKIGAWRIGIGMMPRGEVALIIAGVGIANGIISTDMFGVAILLTLVTTVMAPPLLVPAFKRGGLGTTTGVEEKIVPTPQTEGPLLVVHAKSENHQRLLAEVFMEALEAKGYERIYTDVPQGIYEIKKNEKPVVIRLMKEGDTPVISIDSVVGTRDEIRETLFEVTETMDEYKDHIVKRIVDSDPKFLRKIKRVTSE